VVAVAEVLAVEVVVVLPVDEDVEVDVVVAAGSVSKEIDAENTCKS